MGKTDIDSRPLVTLVELAARTGRLVEYLMPPLKDHVVRDWADRPAVDAATARRFVEAYERERAELEDRRRAFDEYTERWGRRWAEVYARAYAEAREREIAKARQALDAANIVVPSGHVPLTPQAEQAIRDHAREAAAEWERRHPRAGDPDLYFADKKHFDKLIEG